MAVSVENVSELECSASFLINFSGSLICTWEITSTKYNPDAGNVEGQTGDIVVDWGSTPFSVLSEFTRGTNKAGVFKEHVVYTVDNSAPTVNTPPPGVTLNGRFGSTPDFTTLPREVQLVRYYGTIEIVHPNDGSGAFQGTRLDLNVTIGFDPTP